jgi:hypothetical protein
MKKFLAYWRKAASIQKKAFVGFLLSSLASFTFLGVEMSQRSSFRFDVLAVVFMFISVGFLELGTHGLRELFGKNHSHKGN